MPKLSNPRAQRVKDVAALTKRALRTRRKLFLVEGPFAVQELIAYRPETVQAIYIDADMAQVNPDLSHIARSWGNEQQTYFAQPEVFAAMNTTVTPQGIIAVAQQHDVSLIEAISTARTATKDAAVPPFFLVLAQVRDPGNAGSALRSADAAGAAGVIFTTGSVDVFHPKVVRSTVGSLWHLPVVREVPVAETIAALRSAGFTTIAADGAGSSVPQDLNLGGPHAWLMGNEAWGMPENTRSLCDEVARLPIYGKAESLNLAMASTLCCYISAGVISS